MIDTANKRFSLATLGAPWALRTTPFPTGALSHGERFHVEGLYAGDLTPAVVSPPKRVYPAAFRHMLTTNDGWHFYDWFPLPRRMPFRTRTCDDIWSTIDDPTKPSCNDWSALGKGGGRTQ